MRLANTKRVVSQFAVCLIILPRRLYVTKYSRRQLCATSCLCDFVAQNLTCDTSTKSIDLMPVRRRSHGTQFRY